MTSDPLMLRYILIGVIILLVCFFIAFYILKKIGKDPKNILPGNFAHRVWVPLLIFLAALILKVALLSKIFRYEYTYDLLQPLSTLAIILSATWLIILTLKILKTHVLKRYDVNTSDNLKARKIYTQFNILENTIIFIIVILAIGIALMSFDSIRSVGVSVLTSAGIAGIIIGFSAQKAIGTLLAGIQIAFTQPIRLQDAVIVENEWGWIEEITLTYVVIKIWDKRRLVVPSTYFIETPFQNWTKNSADLLGTVFIYTDYTVPVDKIREELDRLLEITPLWDKQAKVVQVTDATDRSMEIRVLVSAKDSPTAFDLRVFIREKLIDFLKENYPESLPKSRVQINKDDDKQSNF
ncbi:mechanosensitive ion channel family protein [Salegentibacter sp. JZCK2]|uniref:mechanosensitive ion channel family protein n=1 Tax=Salegentibacter tibetensis TaxID=2873600 RepID=UPI001CCC0C92|nr:mechanosensitive ion channel domain-containing protein [Salegentibacter tibetensis]MBZ9729355.1 mechanosensitive ion channel family protein [Salegentibacter tibetensis]